MGYKDKYECYNCFKEKLEAYNIKVSSYKEINYGLQFISEIGGVAHTIRIYDSKKNGVKPDFSQVRNEHVLQTIMDAIYDEGAKNTSRMELEKEGSGEALSDIEGNALIGTDESGKGDYFGPLVIAAVYAVPEEKQKLRRLGVDDSKKLKDSKIAVMAKEIKLLCRHEIVVVENPRYNELYAKIGNLNRLLAWGHARVIENILSDTECSLALSDQFGNPELIQNALMERGSKIHLEQRHRAEENVVVAAASVLARNEFVERMKELEDKYNMIFPKGASDLTVTAAREFVSRYGHDAIGDVAKLHFKITPEL
jgi:ribonuclease HIII